MFYLVRILKTSDPKDSISGDPENCWGVGVVIQVM